jgi:hypothetical protein
VVLRTMLSPLHHWYAARPLRCQPHRAAGSFIQESALPRQHECLLGSASDSTVVPLVRLSLRRCSLPTHFSASAHSDDSMRRQQSRSSLSSLPGAMPRGHGVSCDGCLCASVCVAVPVLLSYATSWMTGPFPAALHCPICASSSSHFVQTTHTLLSLCLNGTKSVENRCLVKPARAAVWWVRTPTMALSEDCPCSLTSAMSAVLSVHLLQLVCSVQRCRSNHRDVKSSCECTTSPL